MAGGRIHSPPNSLSWDISLLPCLDWKHQPFVFRPLDSSWTASPALLGLQLADGRSWGFSTAVIMWAIPYNNYFYMHVYVLSHFSCVWLFVTPWTTAHQAPLSMEFSWQEYWSGLPCPPPGNLPDSGVESVSPVSPALQADSLLLSHQGGPLGQRIVYISKYIQHSVSVYVYM